MSDARREPGPMTLWEHFVADCAVKHQSAVRAARELDPSKLTGRTPAEGEVSRLSIALIQTLHTLPALVLRHGVDEVFGARSHPMSPKDRDEALKP